MNWPLLLIAISSVMSLTLASFNYNLTEQMRDETKLLDICIYTDIKIPNCQDIYGGLNKTYGDHVAYGDDSEQCILPAFCDQIRQQKQEDMTQALEIWNAAGCSTRDICTPAACDPDDEAFRVTGHCDPDWADDGNETQTCDLKNNTCPDILAPQIQTNFKPIKAPDLGGGRQLGAAEATMVCFDNKELFDKYRNSSAAEQYPAIYPCPPESKLKAQEELK